LRQGRMSALAPKADMCGAPDHVRFGPEPDIFRAPDHTTKGDIAAQRRHSRPAL
jgi:hypothetical protein